MKALRIFLIMALGLVLTIGVVACGVSNRTAGKVLTTSNYQATEPSRNVSEIEIFEGDTFDNKEHIVIGDIKVKVKKLTLFHSNPTKEDAVVALKQKAHEVGADAVINAAFKFGVGLTSWGQMTATGTTIKFKE